MPVFEIVIEVGCICTARRHHFPFRSTPGNLSAKCSAA